MRTFTCIVDKTNTPPAFLRILTDMDASASTRVITWDNFKVTWRFTETDDGEADLRIVYGYSQ